MWAKPTMHRDAVHRRIAELTGLIAGDIVDQPRRDDALTVERAFVEQALIEHGDAARGAVTAAARQAGNAHRPAIVARLAFAGDRDAATVLLLGHPDIDVIGNAERRHDPFADDVAIIL